MERDRLGLQEGRKNKEKISKKWEQKEEGRREKERKDKKTCFKTFNTERNPFAILQLTFRLHLFIILSLIFKNWEIN